MGTKMGLVSEFGITVLSCPEPVNMGTDMPSPGLKLPRRCFCQYPKGIKYLDLPTVLG